MSVIYCEAYEKNTVRGVQISDMRVKYPTSETVGRTDCHFEKIAERFAETVKNKAFLSDGEEFLHYVENGGRRSAFPKRAYRLFMTEAGRNGKYVSIKTEAFLSVSNIGVTGYSAEYTVWDTETGLVCDKNTFGIKGLKNCDGFFVDGRGVRCYNVEMGCTGLSDYIKHNKNI